MYAATGALWAGAWAKALTIKSTYYKWKSKYGGLEVN
jgi:hypothetical protein